MEIDCGSVVRDADIEMAGLQEAANHAARLRKRGICTHGWAKVPDVGPAKCLECGKVFACADDLYADRRELMI